VPWVRLATFEKGGPEDDPSGPFCADVDSRLAQLGQDFFYTAFDLAELIPGT